VKRKKKKKRERNVEDMRAEGVRGCTCEEIFFFFPEIELMSDVWQREKKKNLWSRIQLWAAVGVGGLLLVGLEKKFNGVF
jgi:hypothetical protein